MSDSVSPWILAHQAPLSMEFPRKEYWSRSIFPTAGDLSNPEIKSASVTSSALAGRFFTVSTTWEASFQVRACVCVLVTQSCPTLCNALDCSLPGSSVHRILEWVTISCSRGYSQNYFLLFQFPSFNLFGGLIENNICRTYTSKATPSCNMPHRNYPLLNSTLLQICCMFNTMPLSI